MNWQALESTALTLVTKALQDLSVEHPDEQFYACALYTDSSAMTMAVAVNSVEALEEKLKGEGEEEREELMPYYKWASSEWKYEGWKGEYFKDICKDLREASDRSDILRFKERLLSLMVNVLSSLRREGFFSSFKIQEPMLFVTVTDDDGAEELENKTAELLNSSEGYNYFIRRFDG
ncbi:MULTISPECIES: DUF4303 domain-containing protein [Pseudomonas]|jgi:hypothetical protein|uniref:DUF4303 domain-containing protein n=2 Tax=Pseudomonas putida group TaxID=136845 RepID=A0A140FWC8_PSEPK|nr:MULTISPECIES: DUF4303 domain-containing protein [Pseudomonas]AMM02911.1 conserved protein of unknown function [Pseudomonas putida KT2440]KMU97615.1 hypothetical protein AC138_00035 [Pseudomonas putida]KMY34073.1 hypothetical protein AA993_15975 [Pseudomonas putida]MBP2841008.1 DUF4303 domain-containing protein [Pseudomonas sp. PNP]MCE0863915.1 DUF4303 domain-containing protein [Pseudomonas alloputida]